MQLVQRIDWESKTPTIQSFKDQLYGIRFSSGNKEVLYGNVKDDQAIEASLLIAADAKRYLEEQFSSTTATIPQLTIKYLIGRCELYQAICTKVSAVIDSMTTKLLEGYGKDLTDIDKVMPGYTAEEVVEKLVNSSMAAMIDQIIYEAYHIFRTTKMIPALKAEDSVDALFTKRAYENYGQDITRPSMTDLMWPPFKGNILH